MDTRVEVKDEQGHVVTEGEGQVFIGETDITDTHVHASLFSGNIIQTRIPLIFGAGGEERVCLLDDEESVVPGTMRATGDWVEVKDAHLRYLGRRDRLIKRHGKRVNLDNLQQVRCFHIFTTRGQNVTRPIML